ncbi:MAG: hypothetical protein WC384_03085 [Prolixibacteraceae bacterium]|jgi:hypothetical protein
METKEFCKHILLHFQQPGQEYFVTWCIKDAVPPKALTRYTGQLDILRSQIIALRVRRFAIAIFSYNKKNAIKNHIT